MSQKILQINLKFTGLSRTELEQAWLPAAQPIADTPGLQWKVWLVNEAEHAAGGIYLFDDEASLQGFLDSPIVTALGDNPTLSDVGVKMFDVMEAHTAITRGPVREGMRV